MRCAEDLSPLRRCPACEAVRDPEHLRELGLLLVSSRREPGPWHRRQLITQLVIFSSIDYGHNPQTHQESLQHTSARQTAATLAPVRTVTTPNVFVARASSRAGAERGRKAE